MTPERVWSRAAKRQEESRTVKVLFLDLDGTVRKGFDELGRFVNKKADVEVFADVPEILRAYKSAGWAIVAVSNQGGVALGHMTIDELGETMMETQRQAGGAFDLMYSCRHHPSASDPTMAHCWCRKPRFGMLVEACYKLGKRNPDCMFPPHVALMVGDREEDRACAESAGVRFIWAKDWRAGAR